MRIIGRDDLKANLLKEITVGNAKVKCFKDVGDREVFLLSSISKVLGYGDPNKLASLLSDERKTKLIVDSGNGIHLSWFVDTLGLVSLIMKSRKLDDKIKFEFVNNHFVL